MISLKNSYGAALGAPFGITTTTTTQCDATSLLLSSSLSGAMPPPPLSPPPPSNPKRPLLHLLQHPLGPTQQSHHLVCQLQLLLLCLLPLQSQMLLLRQQCHHLNTAIQDCMNKLPWRQNDWSLWMVGKAFDVILVSK